MNRLVVILKSKTFWGAVLYAGAKLVSTPKVTPVDLLEAAGTVVAAAGVRDSITKAQAAK